MYVIKLYESPHTYSSPSTLNRVCLHLLPRLSTIFLTYIYTDVLTAPLAALLIERSEGN